jgi:hypothetical protein
LAGLRVKNAKGAAGKINNSAGELIIFHTLLLQFFLKLLLPILPHTNAMDAGLFVCAVLLEPDTPHTDFYRIGRI